MKTSITYRQIISLLSQNCGCPEEEAEKFIRAFVETVGDRLCDQDIISINGLGKFIKNIHDDRMPDIEFYPEQEIADKVNMPFSCFEAIELEDSVTDEMLENQSPDQSDDAGSVEFHSDEIPPIPVISAPADESNDNDESDAGETVPDISAITDTVPSDETEDTDVKGCIAGNDPVEPISGRTYMDDSEHRQLNPVLTFIIGIVVGIIIGGMCGYFIYPRLNKAELTSVELMTGTGDLSDDLNLDETSLSEDSDDLESLSVTEVTEATEVPAVITDTVTRTCYLTTMSRKYYGRYEFWVYIYEENRDRLGDPNRIPPGTVVTIPPIGKYDINPDDSISVQRAINKGTEIYKTYQK